MRALGIDGLAEKLAMDAAKKKKKKTKTNKRVPPPRDDDDATNAIETSLIWRPTDRVDPSRELFWGDKELREIARRARRVFVRGGFTRDYGWRTLPERAGREHEKIGGDILSRWRISGQSFGVRPIARRRA